MAPLEDGRGGYVVRSVAADPPRYAVFDPRGHRITRPVPVENRQQADAIAELCNEVRRLALEERK